MSQFEQLSLFTQPAPVAPTPPARAKARQPFPIPHIDALELSQARTNAVLYLRMQQRAHRKQVATTPSPASLHAFVHSLAAEINLKRGILPAEYIGRHAALRHMLQNVRTR